MNEPSDRVQENEPTVVPTPDAPARTLRRAVVTIVACCVLVISVLVGYQYLNRLATEKSLELEVLSCQEQPDKRLALHFRLTYSPKRLSWPLRLFAQKRIYYNQISLPFSFYYINDMKYLDPQGIAYEQKWVGDADWNDISLFDFRPLEEGTDYQCHVFLSRPELVGRRWLLKFPWRVTGIMQYRMTDPDSRGGLIQSGYTLISNIARAVGQSPPIAPPANGVVYEEACQLVSTPFLVVPIEAQDENLDRPEDQQPPSPSIQERIRALDLPGQKF